MAVNIINACTCQAMYSLLSSNSIGCSLRIPKLLSLDQMGLLLVYKGKEIMMNDDGCLLLIVYTIYIYIYNIIITTY